MNSGQSGVCAENDAGAVDSVTFERVAFDVGLSGIEHRFDPFRLANPFRWSNNFDSITAEEFLALCPTCTVVGSQT